MSEPTILAALTARVLRAAEAVGLDARALREQAGITEAELADPDGRVPVMAHIRLHEAIARHRIGLEPQRLRGQSRCSRMPTR